VLAEHFRREIDKQERSGVSNWDPKAMDLLSAYDWPGNVRELRNIVHRAYIMTEGSTISSAVVRELLPKHDNGEPKLKAESKVKGKPSARPARRPTTRSSSKSPARQARR
jgi:DNA-binding NtrC family response regulator